MLHLQYKTLTMILRCRYLSFIIPLCSALALLLFNSNTCFAIDPSASLTISTPSLSATGKAGEVISVSTDIKVDIEKAETYSLILSVDNPNMTNGSTTLIPGDLTTNNTWGYKWDDAPTYTAPTTEGAELTVPTLESNAINFTKTLTFGAKFDSTAQAGHYTATGTLSLVATPKVVADLSTITYMQDMTPEICENTPLLSGQKYSAEYKLTDKRDSNAYTVRKFADDGSSENSGRCWMTQNLMLKPGVTNQANSNNSTLLTKNDTDIASDSGFTLNSGNSFSSSNYYRNEAVEKDNTGTNRSGVTMYYSWTAATAGAGTSSVASGSVDTSICPKGWTLPTGGTTGTSDFYKLFKNAGLNNSDNLATSGATNWVSDDFTTIRTGKDASDKVIYNFLYTGLVSNNTLNNGTSNGYWWSSTATSSTNAYYLNIAGSHVGPGTDNIGRYYGLAMRCIAREADLSTISTMQEMTPKVCSNTLHLVNKNYSAEYTLTDNRVYPSGVDKTYTVRKIGDQCWMTQNLRIYDATLTQEDSDIKTGEFSLTSTTNKSLFANNDTGKYTTLVYRGTSSDTPIPSAGPTTYYNWFAATAGTGTKEFTTNNASVDTSICPKSWTLPTGGSDSATSDFGKFAAAAGIDNFTTGSTTIRNDVYNFLYTGAVNNGGTGSGTSSGWWWSSTASSTNNAYNLYVNVNSVYHGTSDSPRYYGFAVRCIARNE